VSPRGHDLAAWVPIGTVSTGSFPCRQQSLLEKCFWDILEGHRLAKSIWIDDVSHLLQVAAKRCSTYDWHVHLLVDWG
jgi:hypothetical protein